jgi:TonB family protein
VSQFRPQAPWEFLLSASRTTLQSYELSRLAHAANLRKEIGELLDQYMEENTSAMLARWLIEQRQRSVLSVDNSVSPETPGSNGHGNTSPYGKQLADELSKELASQNHEIQVIDRGRLQDFLAKDLIPAKSVNPALVRSIAFALKTRFVVLGTTKRTNDDVVQLSARLFDVTDKNGSEYIAVVNLLAPKSSIDLSPSRPFDSLPPITSTASGESIYRAGLDGVSLPRCTYAPNPPYSEEARKLQLSGIILVDAVINSEGKLENVRIVRGLPDGLNDRTIATMKTWRCNPALKDGKPVPTRVQLEVNFNLRSQ